MESKKWRGVVGFSALGGLGGRRFPFLQYLQIEDNQLIFRKNFSTRIVPKSSLVQIEKSNILFSGLLFVCSDGQKFRFGKFFGLEKVIDDLRNRGYQVSN